MEDIGIHISELLFDHDCVIVPSLGGFLASNQPARVLFPNHIIFPPYRRIAFNVYLKQNDGLLANHLVETDTIPYSEATQRIDSFTAGCFETLDNGKKVNITGVGTLFYDKEKNILFEPFRNINHLKESFGLESVHFHEIQREEKQENVKPLPEKKIRPSIAKPKTPGKRIIFSKTGQYIGIAAVVAAVAWISLNLYLVAPKKYESTSLNPFDSQQTIINKADSIRNLPVEEKDTNTKAEQETATVNAPPLETTAVVVNKPAENDVIKSTVPSEIPVPSKPVEEKVIPSTGKNHFVIAGVFRIKENAESKLIQLHQLGFANAQIIFANKCNYVCYDVFAARDEAFAMTDSLKHEKMEGWIWQH